MKVLSKVSEVQNQVSNARQAGKIVGLIPTMGALHEGHLALVRRAATDCDFTVVSIFVNPTQFNQKNDFNNYPRDIEADVRMLQDTGCQIVFAPNHDEVYPQPDNTNYNFGELERLFEGAHRPGHFRGVGMVVKRLFEIVKPNRAYFGLKDYQQVLIIRSLVEQFNIDVEISTVPTMREKDGLAMSSRNLLLSYAERADASQIYQALLTIKDEAVSTTSDAKLLIAEATEKINALDNLRVEYIGIANPETLAPIENLKSADHAIALAAVWAGNVRLIDNIELF